MESIIFRLIQFVAFLLLIFVISPIFTNAFALNVSSTGIAKIKDGNMNEAYKEAMEDSMLGAIHWYYKKANIKDIDVTEEFIKFVQGYQIVESELINDNTTIKLRLKVKLDEESLIDARFIINQHSDSVVYFQTGIPNLNLHNTIQNTINNVLLDNSFDLKELDNFNSKVEDPSSTDNLKNAFLKTGASYLFHIKFQPLEKDEFKDSENMCELLTIVDVLGRNNSTKTLQVTTGSKSKNKNYCYTYSIKEAINASTEYIRNNIIKLPETTLKIKEYKIRFINFTNMVNTKNIMDTFVSRGLVKSFKTLSYSQNTVVFNVESFFTEKEISDKIINKNNDSDIDVKVKNDVVQINLNYNDKISNIESEETGEVVDNSTATDTGE